MGTSHKYGGSGDVHQAPQQSDNQPISEAVMSAVAEHAGVETGSLPPLDRSINPNGLNILFDTDGDEQCLGGCVTFSYYDRTVVVQSTGQILIRQD